MSKNGPLLLKHEMLAIHNAVTGELENAKVSIYVTKDKPKYREPFTLFFQAVNGLTVKDIKPVTCKVLLFLMSKVIYGNIIDMSSTDIGEDLGYTTRNIQIAFKELEENRIIIRSAHPSDKRKTVVYLNPYQSWKGTFKDRREVISHLENKNQTKLDLFEESKLPALRPNEEFDK
jgi:hypothetical protein